jgi:hypothetical protein
MSLVVMGDDSSFRADEVALLEKLEAKGRRPEASGTKVQYKRRTAFKLAHKSR